MGSRVPWLQVCLVATLAVLFGRLIDLQLARGGYYRKLAEANRLRLVPEDAPRGLLVDRRGRVLASNQTLFRIAVVPQEADDVPRLLARVGELLRRSPEGLRTSFLRERSLPFLPATIVSYVPKEAALQLEEQRWQLPGLLVRPETVRHYPHGASAAHLLGYLSQPTPEELPLLKQYGVRTTQLVGRMGLEQALDPVLRGRPGGLMVEVDHRARQVRTLGRKPPEGGAKVSLTIDAQLQSLIEEAFAAQTGACVVLDPRTGEVLAMVSRPAFNPEPFATLNMAAIRQVLNSPGSPFMNRATHGGYAPGSTAKLITAAAALEHHLITPDTIITCPGALQLGDRVFHCWNRDGHGPLSLSEALMQSCNVYFMQVGRKLGAARLLEAMGQVGWSHRTGWLLDELPGYLPKRRLSEGEVALLAIGQGELLVTPLQAAVMAAAFANEQWVLQPWVVRDVDGRPTLQRPQRHRLGWSLNTLESVRLGMCEVVRHPSGTGRRAFTPLVSIAGKTGTAQTGVPEQPHGWFVGFCPVEEPRVAMAIVVEHGGSGGDVPAQIARAICEYVVTPETL